MACSSWYVSANVPQYSLRTNHAVRTTNLPAPNCTRQTSQILLAFSRTTNEGIVPAPLGKCCHRRATAFMNLITS